MQDWMSALERDIAAAEQRRIIRIILEDCACRCVWEQHELIEKCFTHKLVDHIRAQHG